MHIVKRALIFVVLMVIVQCGSSSTRVKRIVGGRTAEKPKVPPKPPAPPEEQAEHVSPPTAFLYTEAGTVKAMVNGLVDHSTKPAHYSFKGIRYAEPPVGRFRFQRPRKLPLNGEVDATNFGPPCLQNSPSNPPQVIGSEDCLFLNVYTPKLPPIQVSHFARRKQHCADEEGDDLLPVMVWNHGGGYRQGSANQYGPKHLVAKGVVVVTLQYRLGPLGFLAHGNRDSPGNAALCDQMMALEWVQAYIHAFGGDPKKVSFAGHDAGASAAMLLSQSKYGAGLFRSVVAMSGSSLSAWATNLEPERSAAAVARRVNCPTGANDTIETVRCLQQVSARELLSVNSFEEAASHFRSKDNSADFSDMFSPAAPVVDGPTDQRYLPTILPETPKEGLERGILPKIPLLTGITKDETSNLFSDIQKSDILKKMKEVPGYLEKVFLPQLVKSTHGLTNLTSTLTQTLTGYLGLLPGEASGGPLGRLIEASSDALFALPAFLTSSLWTKSGGPVFLYSFDHPSPFSASVFTSTPFAQLTGSSRTKQATDKSVGHGEDLFFLFEPKTIEGKEEPGLQFTSQDDVNVLDLMTSTVAKFVKTGNPSAELEGQESPWLPFSEDQNNYLSISSKPHVGTQFKFCQMGLWNGISSRLLSPECNMAFLPPSILPPIAPSLPGVLLLGGQPQPGRGNAQTQPQPQQGGGLQIPGILG